jgi:hypothetical protein
MSGKWLKQALELQETFRTLSLRVLLDSAKWRYKVDIKKLERKIKSEEKKALLGDKHKK